MSSDLDFFFWKSKTYLIMVDHFNRPPMYKKMTKTTARDVSNQLIKWFNMYGAVTHVRADHGPPFSSEDFAVFFQEWCINLNLTASYCPTSSGSAERGVGILKELLRKTESEKSFWLLGTESGRLGLSGGKTGQVCHLWQ